MADPPKEPEPAPAEPATEPAAKGSHFDDGLDGTDETTGESAARRRAVDEAMSMFDSRRSGVVIIGDGHTFGGVFGGDSVGAGDQPGPILATVPARVIAELAEVYVEPAGFAELGEPIAGHHLVLLGTTARWGNTATAVRLLAGAGAIHELRFAGRLAELPVDQLPAGAGFILEATEARALASLRLQYLEDLEDRLARAGSRLVVITDADRADEHGNRPVWRSVAAPPGAYDVVLRHLLRRVGTDDRAAELIEQAGVAPELRATAGDTFDIHRLVELACDLAEAAKGHGTVREATERFAARADRAVEQWLDQQVTDDGDLALVLSLAVLNGMPYDAVSRAATLLERRWTAEEPAATTRGRKRGGRSGRLKAARARLFVETRPTRYGPAELEVAAFIDDTYPKRILRHYWHEHDYDRDLILDWLREVADDVEIPVGTRAAIAVGYLGTFAFDTVRRDVIVGWVGSGKGDQRELAVAALRLPARAPETAGRAIGLVTDWSRRNGAAAKMTAARALGGSVGAVLNGGPDSALTRLAKAADGRLSTALGDSIAELMADAEPARQVELLGLFDSWSAEGRNGRQLAGVLGFLQAAWTLRTEDDGVAWPTMLWLAERGREHGDETERRARALIARLWGRALIAPGADSGVRIVLGTWAQIAERTAALRPPLVSLLAEAVVTTRQARLLKAHAESLRTNKPATPDIARKLLDALTEGAARHG